MKIFIDSADLAEIKEAAALGFVEGCTTNPSLLAKAGRTIEAAIPEICEMVTGKEGIRTNVTLCFSANQDMLAAKAGAAYVSPFVGRLDDVGHDGVELLQQILTKGQRAAR
jgi:transaldolase